MFYISEGKIYEKNEDGYFVSVGFNAKNKVIVTKELESITKVVGNVKKKELPGGQPFTLDEIVRKYNLSEENPIVPLMLDESKNVIAPAADENDECVEDAGEADGKPAKKFSINNYKKKDIESLSITELREFVDAHNIECSNRRSKDELIKAIYNAYLDKMAEYK